MPNEPRSTNRVQITDDVMTAWRTHKRLGMVGRAVDGGVSPQTLAGFIAGLHAGGATTEALAGFVDALDKNHRGRGIGSPVEEPQVREYLVALEVVPSVEFPWVDFASLGVEVDVPQPSKRAVKGVPDVGFDPTPEQLVALEKFRTGKHLVIEAGAGSGKTSTLRLLAEDAPNRKGLYFAFNKAISLAARKALPSQVDCRTLHSLAYRPMARKWPWLQDRLQERPMRRQVAAQFGLGRIFEQWRPDPGAPYDSVSISSFDVFVIAEKTVEKFCQSDSPAITTRHLPPQKFSGAPDEVVSRVNARLLSAAQRLWDDLTSEDGVARMSHDVYLKAYALTGPDLGVDYLLLDEAQDCQPEGTVVLMSPGRGGGKDAQKGRPVTTYEKKIEDVKVGDRVVSHHKSVMHLAGDEVTSVASRDYDGDLIRVETSSGKSSRYTPEHICVARIGPGFVGKSILYLMQKGSSFRVGVTKSTHGLSTSGCSGFAGRMFEEKGDATWVLDVFDGKQDALLAEAVTSARFGLPDMRFRSNHGANGSITQEKIDEFWETMGDLTENAERCLANYGRDIRYPLARRNFNAQGNRADYLLYSRGSLTRACNLITGMEVIDAQVAIAHRGERRLEDRSAAGWAPVTVTREPYVGKVWSLSVDRAHTYVADGVVTHNCNDLTVGLARLQAENGTQIVTVGDAAQAIYCQPVGTMVTVPVLTTRPREISDTPQSGDALCDFEGCGRKVVSFKSGLCQSHWKQQRAGIDLKPLVIQCTSVSEVPIETLSVGDCVSTHRNTSIYVSGRKVSAINRFRHTGDLVQVRTQSGKASRYTPKHHCVVRMNPEMAGKHFVYLMRRGDQYRVGRVPVYYASQSGSLGIRQRMNQEGADAAWVLSVHDSIAGASLEEALVWNKYGLPGVRFQSSKNDVMDVEQFWANVGDNRVFAEKCLSDHGRLMEFPFVSKTQRAGTKSPIVTAAANLIDGMLVMPFSNALRRRTNGERKTPRSTWEPIEVTRAHYDGDVVSITVEDHHTYFADGVLTHNSFRGSRNHMRAFDGERATLSTSFRFGQPIADEANLWLTYLGSSMRLTGSPFKTTATVGPITGVPDAYLTRTNAHGVEALIRYQDQDIPTRIADGGKDVRDVAQAAADFARFTRVKHPALRQYPSWEAAVEDAKDEDGDMDGSLAATVKVVAKFGHAVVIRALDTQVPAGKERMTISTAHKAKGLEWDRVRIGDDFPNPYDGLARVVLNPDTGKLEQPAVEQLPNDEAMLAYVAVTRAKEHVDTGSLSWINRAVTEGATTTGEPLG